MKRVRFHAIPLCVLFAGLAHSSQAAPPDFAREIAPLL